MKRTNIFSICPQCGADEIQFDNLKKYACASCGFTFFHNSAAAVGAIIRLNGKLLVIRRADDPGKGLYDIPGGFVDPGESAEQAIRREIREEVGVETGALRYLTSSFNFYDYKGIIYPTCDIFYEAEISGIPGTPDLEEVDEVLCVSPGDLEKYEFAFQSVREAVRMWIRNNT